MPPQMVEGCCAAGALPSSAPIVKKLSYTSSGNMATKARLIPEEFQLLLKGLLNHDPEVDCNDNGLSASPEHEER